MTPPFFCFYCFLLKEFLVILFLPSSKSFPCYGVVLFCIYLFCILLQICIYLFCFFAAAFWQFWIFFLVSFIDFIKFPCIIFSILHLPFLCTSATEIPNSSFLGCNVCLCSFLHLFLFVCFSVIHSGYFLMITVSHH